MPTINGTPQADSLVGTAGEDTLSGYEGNDTLVGAGGNDRLITGDGADSVRAGDGDDEVNGYMVEAATGRFSFFPSTGRKTIYGEAGNDFLVGGSDTDHLEGGTGQDSLHGLEGNDTLLGGDGQDELYGEEGDDRLEGQAGDDSLHGQAGDDTLLGGAGDDELQPGDGRDHADGGDGNDHVNGYLQGTNDGAYGYWVVTGPKTLSGGAGDDVVVGGPDADVLSGDAGQDVLHGRGGSDLIRGGDGNDMLGGDDGNDTLDGGGGIDTLEGGLGNDTYIISNLQFSLRDEGGTDTVQLQVSYAKLPGTIEKVAAAPGVQALPYWIDALLPDEAAGLQFRTLLGEAQVMNYSFPTSLPAYDTSAEHALGYTAFTTTQISRAEAALRYVETVAGLRFVRTHDPNAPRMIAFANNQQTGSAGYAYYPSDSATGSDLFLNKDSPGTFTLVDGEHAVQALIHELGHALGLEHPFAESDTSGHVSDAPHLPASEDTTTWTVMSYTDGPEPPAMMFRALDIAALQYLYGPGANRTGNDTYRLDASAPNFIWDGAGTDRIDVSAWNEPVTLFLSPGYWGHVGASRASLITAPGQVTVNFGTVIEEALGSRLDDRIVGNDADNRLMGGAGRDTLTGGAGRDTLEGGDGEDTATFANAITQYYYERDTPNGPLRVTALNGREGTDALLSVETVAFADRTVATAGLGVVTSSPVKPPAVPELYHFFVVAFAGAPGATYMGQLMEAYNYFSAQPREAGDPTAVQQIVEIFTSKPQFTGVYPTSMSSRELATQLVNRVVKASAAESAKNEAIGQIESALAIGWSRGQMLYTVFGNLANKALNDPVWGQTALQFQKQLAVARYLTETLAYESTDVAKLQAVLADVTPQTDVSTPMLIAQIIGSALPGG